MRKALLTAVCLLLSLVSLDAPCLAAEGIIDYPLRGLEILTLRDHSLKIEHIASRRGKDFRPLEGNSVRFWNVESTLWLRIPSQEVRRAFRLLGREVVLTLRSEYISRVDLYLPVSPKEFRSSVRGLDVFFGTFPSRYPSFMLEEPYGDGYIYLKLRTNVPTSFTLSIQEVHGFHARLIGYFTQYMAFYSFMAALILTYLFFYFMTGDPGYFIVMLRQAGMLVFLFAFNGYFQYYFRLSSSMVYVICWVALGLHYFMGTLFCRYLLTMDTGLDWLQFLLSTEAVTAVVMAFSALWPGYPNLTLSILSLVAALEITAFFSIGYVKFRQGYRLILLFVLSRLIFIVGYAALVLDVLFVWRTDVFMNLFMIGFLLPPLILAFMMIPGTRRRFENYFALEDKNTYYESLGARDDVTGLYNKARHLALLDENIRAARLNERPLAFILLNIDRFQEFNKTWGHAEGDKRLLLLAKLIRQNLRESDVAARHGGGEFGIILPGGTLPSAVLVAERIRQTFEKQTTLMGEAKAGTLSLGLSFLGNYDSTATLIRRADDALERAKNSGQNCTEFEITP
ncbi:MAG: sensor domain-containing diguanylate cyclase [Synergistaceae bacterium]|jgi:diguanylate cyclase (GGDEF)-like protein|nr:sensor domain-containing diguanylate cyclase [Synergistaceae bacterium]